MVDDTIRVKIYKLYMDQALVRGGVECPECGEFISPDDGVCGCGWENPIPEDIIKGGDTL